MQSTTTHSPVILRDLGGGLVLRRVVPADAEALVTLQTDVFRAPDAQGPDLRLAAWSHDLLSGSHPTFKHEDFTVVEDTHTGALVSSLNLISQRWTYAGIEFGVGRPELVCTHPDYRQRGLIRAQFEVIHRWSAERGEEVQGITGIPWYYRQFGYEMAMDLGGSRAGQSSSVPKLKEGENEPYMVRPAVEAKLPFVMQMYAQASRRSLVTCVRDETMWRYELGGRRVDNMQGVAICLIERPGGEVVGCIIYLEDLWNNRIPVTLWELVEGVPWPAVAPSVLRYLIAAGGRLAAKQKKECNGFALSLGAEHPIYQVIRDWLPIYSKPYAWYLRVADLPGFLRHIAPALERHLAASPAAGHTGELKISFYRDGLRLVLDQGRLAQVDHWMPSPADGGMAAFPGLTFLQLLFGYRNLEELRYAFADCWASGDQARLLLEALFPKQASLVWPVS